MPDVPSIRVRTASLALASAVAAALAALAFGAGPRPAAADDGGSRTGGGGKVADVKIVSPRNGDEAGVGNAGWVVDLRADFKLPLEKTGFGGLQLTGPAGHNDVAPFPGTFSPGQDDRFKSLVVLVSTTTLGAGAGQNVANLFNLTGVTHRDGDSTQIWDTWIVGAPLFGTDTDATVYAAIAADRNGNGVLDDAPATVVDADRDGDVDERDLKAVGLASGVDVAHFHVRS